MRVVVQRVSEASVIIGGKCVGKIDKGLCVFVGIVASDTKETIKWMSNKLVNLRIFPDEEDKMNRSVLDIDGGILLISNFTLYGDVQKGFRPSFGHSAPTAISEPLYQSFLEYLRSNYEINIESGVFGAMMDISLVNHGPVTIIIEK